MINIGRINKLQVLKSLDFGVYLDGLEFGEILLPSKFIPLNLKIGDMIEVFIYFDSEDRLIATTQKPYAQVGEIASLKVVSVNSFGAFLNWGLDKDLLFPSSEQKKKVTKGDFVLVYVYIDRKTKLIAASEKINKFIETVVSTNTFNQDQSVDLLIYEKLDFGYKAIIDQKFSGIIYKNETFQDLKIGQELKGFIKKIRDDGKIDLSLFATGYTKIAPLAEKVLEKLKENDGFISIAEKSSPEQISKFLGMSKKSYKLAISYLYKQRLIQIEKTGVRLVR